MVQLWCRVGSDWCVCVCVLVELWFSMGSAVGGLLLVGSAWVQLVVASGYIV